MSKNTSSKNTSKNTSSKRESQAAKTKREQREQLRAELQAAVAPIVAEAAPAEAAPIVAEAAPVAPAIPVAPAAPKPTKTRDIVLSLIRLSLIAKTQQDADTLRAFSGRLGHRAAKEAQKSPNSKEGKLIQLIKAASTATVETLPDIAKIGAESAHRLGTDYYSESRYSSTFDKTVEAFRPVAPVAPAEPQAAPVG